MILRHWLRLLNKISQNIPLLVLSFNIFAAKNVNILKSNKERLILVTNDDGIEAKGLKALIEAVEPYGTLVVVAPSVSKSGMSHAITVNKPLHYKHIKNGSIHQYYACEGTPVDCVKIAKTLILDKRPDLIVSGINHGSNASTSIFYSGTMAAALEGGIVGIPAIGFSLLSHLPDADFTTAKTVVKEIIEMTINKGIPDNVTLNVNIPDLDSNKLKGIRICRQTKGYWQEDFNKHIDSDSGNKYWLTGDFINLEPDAQDTDEWALKNGYVSVVPINVDLTSYSSIQKLKEWKLD